MRRKNKTIIIMLAVAVLVAVLCIILVACGNKQEESKEKQNAGFEFRQMDNGTYSICNYYGDDPNICIPNEYDGKAVTSIDGGVFYGNMGLKTLTISEGITSIGGGAFYGCTGLTEIAIPDSVTNIGYEAFRGCTNITTATMPAQTIIHIPSDNLTNITITSGEIPQNAFYGCIALKIITIGESVTSIGNDAFYGCEKLTKVNIMSLKSWCEIDFKNKNANPLYAAQGIVRLYLNEEEVTEIKDLDGLITIPDLAFYRCTGITKVNLPNSLISIGDEAFWCCNNLKDINIPYGVISIGNEAFYGCNALTEINIPDSVTKIGREAFYSCDNLQIVTIGEGVTSINIEAFSHCDCLHTVNWNAKNCSYAGIYNGSAYLIEDRDKTIFKKCNKLTTINIGEAVQSIPAYTFYGCIGLKTVNWKATNCTKVGNSSNYAIFDGCSQLDKIDIGENVQTIPAYAFFGCTGLVFITIPYNVTNIGDNAFEGCINLRTVDWNATKCLNAGSINNSIFKGCEVLTKINIGDNVQTIPNCAFSDCIGLSEITIPSSVAHIGSDAFEGCTGIRKVNYCGDLKEWCEIESDGTPLNGNAKLYVKENGKYIEVTGDITIPVGTSKIGRYAFYELMGITSVSIPTSVTSIGKYAFSYCTGLGEVAISDSVQRIENCAFNGCTGLKTTTINAQYIEKDAFHFCIGLETVSIGESVRYIENDAFSSCKNIKSICVAERNTEYQSKDGVMYYKADKSICFVPLALEGAVTILEGCTIISSKAFSDLTNLQTVIIGESVKRIVDGAFANCTGLQEITIGEGVINIDKDAFSGCIGLKSISIAEKNTIYQSKDGVVYQKADKTIYFVPIAIEGSIVILEGCPIIADDTFHYCTSLVEITIPDSVTNIGASAFYNCIRLQKVTINAQNIGENAFGNCTDLKIVTIGNNVINIDDYAFADCRNLKTIIVADENMVYQSKDGIVYKRDDKSIYIVPECIEGEVAILDGCVSIGINEFAWCKYLRKITIPNSVKSIGYQAFDTCVGLIEATIPDSVTDMGDNLFYNCKKLQVVTIGNGVTVLGENTFYGCTSLKYLTIGENVTSIGENAFYECYTLVHIRNLSKVQIQSPAKKDGEIVTDCDTEFQNKLERDDNGIWTYTVGETVYAIGYDGIDTNLDLSLNNTINAVYPYAFYRREDITAVNIPNNVASIGSYAFYSCENLSQATINAQHIGTVAFSYCTNLQNVIIGESVASIGVDAFEMCMSLRSVYYIGTSKQWNDLSIGYNNYLQRATHYYFSEENPYENNTAVPYDRYWHWNEDCTAPEVWEKQN